MEVSNLLAPTRQGALEQEVLALREAVEDSEVYTLVPRSPRVRKMSVVRRKKETRDSGKFGTFTVSACVWCSIAWRATHWSK